MATTTDYLNKLVTQKNTLADNLVTKGVTATHDETLETLVPKVLDISGGGGGNGIYPIGEDGRPTGNVTVPEGVTSLCRYIFSDDVNVTSVKLPESLTKFENYCFNGCSGLTEFDIPNNVTAISEYCFNNCSGLTQITLSAGTKSIGMYAFQNCKNLTNINIPDDTSYSIGNSAFYNSGITNDCAKNIVSHANSIGSYVFRYCLSLTDVEVSFFSEYMFYQCANLITAKSTQATTNSGSSVFYDCTNLTTVSLADGITNIGTQLFYNCKSLKTVYLPSSITSASGNSLTSTSPSYYIFYNCTALEDVQLGQNWNMSLRLDVSNNITVDSMIAMFNSLKDLTGDTAKTLTLGETNLAKLTDEQKAIATDKNWTLA